MVSDEIEQLAIVKWIIDRITSSLTADVLKREGATSLEGIDSNASVVAEISLAIKDYFKDEGYSTVSLVHSHDKFLETLKIILERD